ARGRAGWKAAAAAGALTGFAATMRTDAFVYAAVIGLVTFVALLRRHAAAATMLRCGAAGAVGFVALIAANLGLEELTLGASLRAGRAADTAASAGAGLRERVHEAFTTLLGINRISTPGDWVMGALIVAAVVYGGWRARSRDAAGRRIGVVVLSIAALLYVAFVVGDLGFVPGLLTASPLAAIGLAACAQPNLRWLAAIAFLAIPIVWAVQYSGGAAPQWGARYLLVSSALLAIAGATWLARSGGAASVGVVALALLVTLSGVAWLHERSHD